MKYCFFLVCFISLLGCHRNTSYTVFDNQYYINLKQDASRLHHLMQGSFVVYSEEADHHLKKFNVTGQDSVVLYSIPFANADGYWVYSYEFMTSMPNDPTYVSIKQIQSIHPDTFQVFYYNAEKFTLKQILQDSFLDKNIDPKSLVPTDKTVFYTRQTSSSFLGKSLVYEDKECRCLRQNNYQIDPNFYNVTADFFTKKDKIKIDKPQRPNLLVRRDLPLLLLKEIAQKEYNLKSY